MESKNRNTIVWQYMVYPDDDNFNYREDKKQNFMDHDINQSIAIETEYQQALKKNMQTHTFLLSGNFKKHRNNNEYAIVFEDIKVPQTWYKTNTKSFRFRPLRRVQKKEEYKQPTIINKQDQQIKRWPEKKAIWQYKVFVEDLNYKAREDEFMHYVNHDQKQSELIEKEYQLALLQKKSPHQFILSGDWEKDRCKWEYEIIFEELDNPDKWFKQNTITKKRRPITRIEIWIEQEDRLVSKQKLCLKDIAQKSKKESDEVRPILQKRCQQLGLKLEIIEQYIAKQAPLIVHIHLDKYLNYYVKDTHYRNQFETGNSSGSKDLKKREGWEVRMFDNYYDNSLGSERPKYGIINVTNNPRGDYTCRKYGYGNDFLELKNDIRERCTFTNKDSSFDDAVVGTLTNCCHVLNACTDEELQVMQLSAEGKYDTANQVANIMYKEIQIHGPLEFHKDVTVVHICSDHNNNKELIDLLQTFKTKFNINLQFIEGEPDEKKIEKLAKIEENPDYGNR